MNLLKKLNAKTICGPIKAPEGDEPVSLYKLVGAANGIKTGSTNLGDWIGLTGNFLAIRGDGERFASGIAFVHEPILSMLASQVDKLEIGESIEFAIETFIVKDESVLVGYQYQVAVIEDPDVASPFAELEAKFAKLEKLALAPATKKADKAA